MMFTSSDVASLARELWWWEHAEYVFAALVTIACFGEYLSEFGKRQWIIAHKDRIAKLSTLLLVGALSLELTCLVETNDISGKLIGSLRDKAEEADSLAQDATLTSGMAIAQSGQAEIESSAAGTASGKAQTASANALNFARGARQEADSFAKDIVLAKQQATEAESHLAEALREAAAAQKALLELQNRINARRLSEKDKQELVRLLADELKPNFVLDVLQTNDSGVDSQGYANDFADVFSRMGWKVNPVGIEFWTTHIVGVLVVVRSSNDVPSQARAVVKVFNAVGIPTHWIASPNVPESAFKLVIGAKE